MRGPGLFCLICFLLIAGIDIQGQNLINSGEDEILKYVRKNYPEMVLEKDFKNDHYKYLKFVDGERESCTMLFFMSDENICTSVRLIYDPDLKKEVIAGLNSKYRYVGENLWYDGSAKQKASIELKIEDWFLTVSITPVKSD